MDAELVERVGKQIDDVLGQIGEVIADAHDTAVVGDDATAIAVDKTEDELLRGLVDEVLLPRCDITNV